MTETPDAKTFDLIGYLSGRDLPTREVKVPFDEDLLLEIQEVSQARQALGLEEEDMAKLDAQMKALEERYRDESFTLTLKALPESVRRDITDKVLEEYPSEKDSFGRETPHPDSDAAFALATWAAYIVTVTDPSGNSDTVGESGAKALYDNAPAAVHVAINEGIGGLMAGSTRGYQVAKELNFLSEASPEG